MRQRTSTSYSEFARLCHGALFGGLMGALVGLADYLSLFLRQAYSGDQARAYWDITLPYIIVGLFVGILTTVGVRLIFGAPSSPHQYLARFLASLSALVAFSVLIVCTTYLLRPPILKLANLIAYLASTAVTVVAGYLLYRFLSSFFSRQEGRGTLSPHFLRIRLPAGLILVTVGILFVPLVYLNRSHSAQFTPTVSSTDLAKGKRPNIVFILIDTLRADHLPIYGYTRQTAPNLTALAQQGITFKHMHAQASWTKPSIATLFSSLYPSVHKVSELRDFVPDSLTTLPEALRAAGYKTFGVSSNIIISSTFGFGQGFEELRLWKDLSAFRLTMLRRVAHDVLGPKNFISRRLPRLLGIEKPGTPPTAAVITDIALNWVSQNHEQPFFLYVHYMDPHDPYSALSPYDQAFDYRRTPPIRAGGIDPLKLLSNGHDPKQVGQIIDQYDGEILYTDFHIGRLFKELEKLRATKDLLTIATADHGEEFFEHGQLGHGHSAYEELLHVPFFIRWPSRIPAGGFYEGTGGLIDVMPTLLDLLDTESPPGIQGTSLAAALVKPDSAEPERLLFSETRRDSFEFESVLQDRKKLIRHVFGPQQGAEELYDLAKDPLERTNLAVQAQDQVAALQQELEAFNKVTSQAAQHESRQVELDKDTEKVLRSLGYIK